MLKVTKKPPLVRRKKVEYEKVARAQGILRSKRLKPRKLQRSLRNEWK